jgi:hypothetical protein
MSKRANVALRAVVGWLAPSRYRRQLQCFLPLDAMPNLQNTQLDLSLDLGLHCDVDVQIHVQPHCRGTSTVMVMLWQHGLVRSSDNMDFLRRAPWGKLPTAVKALGSCKTYGVLFRGLFLLSLSPGVGKRGAGSSGLDVWARRRVLGHCDPLKACSLVVALLRRLLVSMSETAVQTRHDRRTIDVELMWRNLPMMAKWGFKGRGIARGLASAPGH